VTGDPCIRCKTATPYPYVIFYEVTDREVVIHAIPTAPAIRITVLDFMKIQLRTRQKIKNLRTQSFEPCDICERTCLNLAA
jgi:hypothetical protein